VRAEDLPKLREIAGWMMPASQAETGCLAYSYAEDLTDPGLIHVIECWVDDAALSTHFQTPTWPASPKRCVTSNLYRSRLSLTPHQRNGC
jgi:quinol monooxygenase YgiN